MIIKKYYIKPIEEYGKKYISERPEYMLSQDIYKHSSQAFIVVDDEWNTVFHNSAFDIMCDINDDTATFSIKDLLKTHSVLRDIKENLSLSKSWGGALDLISLKGRVFPARLSITASSPLETDTVFFIIHIVDITTSIQRNNHIEYLMNYDPATSLPNQLSFSHHLDSLQDRLKEGAIDGYVVAIYRIVGFSRLCDLYGKESIYSILAEMGLNIGNYIGEKSIACLGNHEVAAAFTYYDMDELIHKLVKIGKIISSEYEIKNGTLSSDYCCGYYTVNGIEENTVSTNKAMLALHNSTHENNTRITAFSDTMMEDADSHERLRAILKLAVDQMAFEIVYQPQNSIHDNSLVGVEALLRWKQDDGTYISPAIFVPLLEKMGVIYEVGLWVLRESCLQGKQWLDEGIPPFNIAVNVSAMQLLNENFPRDILETLSKTHFPPQLLELELTESCMIEDPSAAEDLMCDLAAIGVKVAIDDFGTGYSSLAYLERFSTMDKLKIDKAFVDMICTGKESAITNAIISMAKSLNLKAIAEGVENEEQLLYLKQHGCDQIQGYLISKPLSAVEMARFACLNNKEHPKVAVI
ncbi:putative bifunctional diguanylate cyclase/phosphodiesterase [Mariprofundus aestuarium]|nr:bifunctional diguanylate cyclase/phosphodiesterase [Mariprofundus aestuarium]